MAGKSAIKLSAGSSQSLRDIQIVDDRGVAKRICVPDERSLRVLLDGAHVGTLMTLGAAPEWLVAGYVLNQSRVGHVSAIRSIDVDWQQGVAQVQTRGALEPCAIAEFDARPPLDEARFSRNQVLAIQTAVEQCEAVFRTSGSVHGCALFHDHELWLSVEDVSRRNAVDCITGWMALFGVSGRHKVMYTTGRLSTELVNKAAQSGISVLISRKGITATAYDLAAELGMMLFGRAADQHFVCFTGAERFDR